MPVKVRDEYYPINTATAHRFTVTDEDGNAVEGATITVTITGADGIERESVTATDNSGGKYLALVPAISDISNGDKLKMLYAIDEGVTRQWTAELTIKARFQGGG